MPKKKLPDGTKPLIFIVLFFIATGIALIYNPTTHTVTSGTDIYATPDTTTVISGDETKALGGLFVGLGVLIGYFAYKFAKSE